VKTKVAKGRSGKSGEASSPQPVSETPSLGHSATSPLLLAALRDLLAYYDRLTSGGDHSWCHADGQRMAEIRALAGGNSSTIDSAQSSAVPPASPEPKDSALPRAGRGRV